MNLIQEEIALLEKQGASVTVGENGSLMLSFDISGEMERWAKIQQLSPSNGDSVRASVLLARKLKAVESVMKVYYLSPVAGNSCCDDVDELEPALSPIPDIEVVNELSPLEKLL